MKLALWHECSRRAYDVAAGCAEALMVQSPYPPSVAALRKQVVAVTTPLSDNLDPPLPGGLWRMLSLYGCLSNSAARVTSEKVRESRR